MTSSSSSKSPPPSPVEAWKQSLSGAVGGISAVLITHPLDTWRIRIQTTTTHLLPWRSLYKGLGLTLCGVVPLYAITFGNYAHAVSLFPATAWTPTVAGAVAGLSALPMVVVGERLKILLQLHPQATMFEMVKRVYSLEGLQMFTRGAGITALRDSLGWAVWFGTYVALNQSHSFNNNNSFTTPTPTTTNTPTTTEAMTATTTRLKVEKVLLSGAVAGVLQWVCILPLDVVKTRVQAHVGPHPMNKGVVWRELWREKALFRGLSVALLRAALSNAVAWLGTETTMLYLH